MTTPIGKYKLIKLIAAGGMAEVYLAKQAGAAGFEKLVCLKRILPHLARDKQFVDMFLNEARLAAQLDHPNIVQIFDLGEANGNYFIAMEFIDGPNLRSVAKRATELGELLPIPEVIRVIAQAAGGLHYAHDLADPETGQSLGLVHRDISPDNVLVHKNGSVKVVDFGIAKAAGSSGATRTGTLKGKVAYMPPEQLRGEPLDRRVDVFALGVVMYELLAGKRPWEGSSEVALISQIMSEEPQPLSELRPDAPEELLGVVERALCKDREQRYQTCQELQQDLEQALVSMGQSVTVSRVAEFVRSYAPEPSQNSATTGVDQADLSLLEEQAFGGTGAAPPLVGPNAQLQHDEDQAGHVSNTQLMDEPLAPPPRANTWKYGVGAFLGIAILGGIGFFALREKPDDTSHAVAVERSSIAVNDKPPAPPLAAVEPKKEAPKPADPPKAAEPVVEQKKEEPKKKERKLAAVTPKVEVKEEPPKVAPPPPAVVIIKQEEPKPPPPIIKAAPPPPTVTAKGELVFLIRPWAEVHVDGKKLGIAPGMMPVQVSVGSHTIRLVNPDLNKDVSRVVNVSANGREVVKELFE